MTEPRRPEPPTPEWTPLAPPERATLVIVAARGDLEVQSRDGDIAYGPRERCAAGVRVELRATPVYLHRGPGSGPRLPYNVSLWGKASAVWSRQHTVFHRVDGAWLLEDRGSTTGTWVNGQRVDWRSQPAVVLHDGDLISYGPDDARGGLELRFEVPSA